MRAWARKWRPSSDFVRNCCQNVPLGVKMTPNHRFRAGLLRKFSSEHHGLPAPLQRPAPPQPLRARAAACASSTRCGSGSKPTLCCLAQRRRKRRPNGCHRVHDLVRGNGAAHARERQLRRAHRARHAHSVSRLAGELHHAAHRVADQPERVRNRERGRIQALRGRAAEKLHQGAVPTSA